MRRAVAALALACVVGAAGCTSGTESEAGGVSSAGSAGSSANAAAPSPSSGVDPVAAKALEALLTRRERAFAHHDRPGYAATVADPQSPAGRAQIRSFQTAVALGVSGLAHDRTFTDVPGAAPLTFGVVLRYRVGGVDTADRTASVEYHLARSDGQWRVVSERPAGPGSTAPWLGLPGASVRRTEHVVVAGTVAADHLSAYAEMLARARADLARTWDLPDQVLLLAPATSAEADVLLGRAPGGAPVAATTEGPVGSDGTATGDAVILDPDAFARLTRAGRQVVIAHELTHIAVRATVAGRSEPWVAEGYAEHVGFGYAAQPAPRIAAPLVLAVRAGSAPTRLPDAQEVDPARGDIEVAYLASWQAVELLVDRHGEEAVRRFVLAASSTGSEEEVRAATDRALREVLATTRGDLTRDWQMHLRALGG